jgi:hypothetical protein
MSKEIDDLKWIRSFSADIIPRYLIEQIKDKDFSVEDFYKYQNLNCLIDGSKGPSLNPFNHLYILVNKENVVKGFLWALIDPLSKDMIVNTFSMDNEYWYGGKSMKKAIDHVKEIIKKLNIKKVYWLTNYPKQSERYGFKRSKTMGNNSKERCEYVNPSTAATV